jgi:hypothetical protein
MLTKANIAINRLLNMILIRAWEEKRRTEEKIPLHLLREHIDSHEQKAGRKRPYRPSR